MLKLTRQEEAPTPRYDQETVTRAIAMAQRLERQHQETLDVQQVEALGEELGISPVFLHQALQELEGRTQATTRAPNELKTAMVSLAAPLVFGLGAFILARLSFPISPVPPAASELQMVTLAHLGMLLAPLVVSLLTGFYSGKRPVGAISGLLAALSATPALAYLAMAMGKAPAYVPDVPVMYALLGGAVNAGLGALGAVIRQRNFPTAGERVTRLDLIKALRDLQAHLREQKQHRAFLSVDVVGSTEMKRSAADLDVEFAFGRYRDWVEGLVRACGGVMQSAAGDGMMAMFPDDAGALRAARRLLEGLPAFNRQSNVLPVPFAIRCGVSAGEVALEPDVPIGHLQSPVLDRAAKLQKAAEPGQLVLAAELAGAALVELGTPEALSAAEGTAFGWKPPTQS